MTSPNNIILVPTDLSDQTLTAISQSFNLARFSNAKLMLMHVDDGSVEKIKEKMDDLVERVKVKSGLEVDYTVVKGGNVCKVVLKAAGDLNVKMIIMGLSSNLTYMDKVIGFNALRLVRLAPCPVVTIRGKKHTEGCKNILLPLDLSKQTREKVTKAIELAKYFGSVIRIVSILTSTDEREENKLISYGNQAKTFIKSNGVKCTLKTLRGKDIANLVMQYANEVHADLIMLMTQQELNIKELFIGTQAQRIIASSNIPVLSIVPIKRKDTTVATSPY